MTADLVRYDVSARGIATITIDRPEKRNAMTDEMGARMRELLAGAGEDDQVRVVILTGTGGAFCSGIDVSTLKRPPGQVRPPRDRSQDPDYWWALTRCPKPVIAAIDGYAVGMGAEFASHCDVRIASTRAKFSWNFGLRGLVPDTGAGTWLLPRLIGPQQALRLLYSAAVMEAAEALRIGFVSAVVEPEALHEAAIREAESYLKCAPMALRYMKELVWHGLERGVEDHMAAHTARIKECFASEDHREGVASFLEKRPARFVGR